MTIQTNKNEPNANSIIAVIRPALEQDIPVIRDIYNYFVSNSTATFATAEESLDERKEWFTSHQNNALPIVVAEHDGHVVGWASFSYYHQRCAYRQTVEISFYIHHQYVGRGIGSLLAEDLLRRARSNGYHCVVSLVCSENESSIALLKKFDFETVGVLREVGRKFDRWLDVTLLQKLLET